jgi:hypothetical protein
MEKRMKSSVTEMMDDPLMMPSQPPILAANFVIKILVKIKFLKINSSILLLIS